MLCPRCGTQNDDNSAFCFECGQNLPSPVVQQPQNDPAPQDAVPRASEDASNPYAPPARIDAVVPAGNIANYMTQAIILCVVSFFSMCCSCLAILGVPFSIVALVYANKVNSCLAAGNTAEAQRASDNARLWCWIACGVLVISILLGLLFFGATMLFTFLQDLKQ